ncbi:MAG: PQQ-dependent sugar dehydrogenase [Sphingomonadales bacterium]|nr:PQQ-dependent sugar dehydrogenase [Sphingomonadales bacterium]
MRLSLWMTAVFPLALCLASCGRAPAGDICRASTGDFHEEPGANDFIFKEAAQFDAPWAMAFLPGTPFALVTEHHGGLLLWQEGGATREVAGVPGFANIDQAGLGDVVLAPDYATSHMVYLSWAESGSGDTLGAAVGRARLVLDGPPRLEAMQVIWRQQPKVAGDGHFSHRIAFSPDGKYLFISSGDRKKFTPAQDLNVNLGKIVRLLPDGRPAPGNPFAAKGGVAAQIWSYGHRNVLGLKFDAQGRLWDLEHGPAGGDELNLVKPGQNYGWPLVSNGDNYDGTPIPRHSTRPDLAAPAISWNPVIAPGDFIFYGTRSRGDQFPGWRGQAVIAAMKPPGVVRVAIACERAREVARHPMPQRIREIVERDDGSVWLLEDGPKPNGGRLWRLTPIP